MNTFVNMLWFTITQRLGTGLVFTLVFEESHFRSEDGMKMF